VTRAVNILTMTIAIVIITMMEFSRRLRLRQPRLVVVRITPMSMKR
jgi:hypothetical protein